MAKPVIIATHVLPAVGFGGTPVVTSNVIYEWAKQGHEFSVCASDGSMGPPIRPEEVCPGGTISVQLYHAYIFRRWGFGLGALPKILAACRKASVVCIQGIATWPCTLAALMCWMLHKPYIVGMHGGLMPEHVRIIRQKKPHKWLYYNLLNFPTLRRASAIYVSSAMERDGVLAVLPKMPPAKVIPNGMDMSAPGQFTRPPRDYNSAGLILSYVGRIYQEKGINRFLRIWLRSRQPDDRMIITGSGVGAYFAEFEKIVSESGGAIDFRGYVSYEEVAKAISESDYLILPSGIEKDDMRENFGNAVAEAFAVSRPVLATRNLIWNEMEPRGVGFLFDKDDDSIKKTIDRARETRKTAAYLEMCKNARIYAEKNFDISVTAEKLWQLCEKAADPRKALKEDN